MGTNPEQLLAAAYPVGFLVALVAARLQDYPKLPPNAEVPATVGFGLRADGGFGVKVTLEVGLPGFAKAQAEHLMEKARDICSLCDATRQEVLRLKLV